MHCESCGRPETPDHPMISVIDEDGSVLICQLCAIRVIGSLASRKVGVSLVLMPHLTAHITEALP